MRLPWLAGQHSFKSRRQRAMSSTRSHLVRNRVRLQKLLSATAKMVFRWPPAASQACRMSRRVETVRADRLEVLQHSRQASQSADEAFLNGFLMAGHSTKRTGRERGDCLLVRYNGTSSPTCRKRKPHMRLKRNLGDSGSR